MCSTQAPRLEGSDETIIPHRLGDEGLDCLYGTENTFLIARRLLRDKTHWKPLGLPCCGCDHIDNICCNPFLGPHIKNNKIQKNSKNILSKKYNSEKMPERPKNAQKLIEDVQKYKNYFFDSISLTDESLDDKENSI